MHLYKLRIYALFKSEIKIEDYLRHVKDCRHRKVLTKFRIGVLPLRVESGRYEAKGVENRRGIPIQFRVCECCDLGRVEDEIHFMLECPLYSSERQVLLKTCGFATVWASNDCTSLFAELMKCSCPVKCRAIAKFVFDSFCRRSAFLKKNHER